MGWSIGFDTRWKRDIGYGVPAICDHPNCSAEIDRGLSHVCGGEPYGGEEGCGLHFCTEHLGFNWDEETDEPKTENAVCARCQNDESPFAPKPDSAEWINFKLIDPSWAEWRAKNPAFVRQHKAA